MGKLIEGEWWLSPNEAASLLGISYKTLQRWTEGKKMNVWTGPNGKRKRIKRTIKIEVRHTPTGYRLYRSSDIDKLNANLGGTNESK